MISPEERRHGGFFLVPAGALIGFGLGILAGYMWTGLLIGLGCGFLVFVTDRPRRTNALSDPGSPSGPEVADVLLLLTGVYIILSGVAIIVVPARQWPDIAAGFFLIFGIWFSVRGLVGRRGSRD
ncbi:MAG TPA: hypothetical protein VMC42_05685 [Methanoregulaceae archaeon]|nr:hypothetical protein [Methanoregulaceae archaeon]